MNETRIAVIGAGSMGTALARLLSREGEPVALWAFEPQVAQELNTRHTNETYLKGFTLPPSVRATSELAVALRGAQLVLSVTPSQVLRDLWRKGREHLEPNAVVVCASKGVERGTGLLMSEVLDSELGPTASQRLAFFSGPSFAQEIAEEQPTAVVIASRSPAAAELAQRVVSSERLRIYTSDDVVGVELGGALKNVMAIAVGAAEGMGLGLNSRAALITRGLAEVTRLAVACGANPLTLSGLAGMGDLVLTCTGHLSRNLQVGLRIGRGERLSDILASTRAVAEGVETARSTLTLAARRGVEMPITEVVVALIDGALTRACAVEQLMNRPLRAEREHG